ncbi:MAG: hypothetical protein HN404_20505 [Gemmatimonadetes bacterium]|nr:hypothetical protein [Gemmatimonadota bacterium]
MTQDGVQAIDFARSFLWWQIDTDKLPPGTITVPPPFAYNNARMPLDCLCTVKDGARQRQFGLGASCKTEAVGAERDIWPQPNSDFKQVLSDDGESIGVKTYEIAGKQIPFHPPELGMQPERQVCRTADVYQSARIDITRVPADSLDRAGSAQAALDNRIMTARTTYQDGPYEIILDYPVKTMNANERDGFSQPDTGPVLVVDAGHAFEDLIQGLQLAYIAFNRDSWAELLIREPVEVAPGVSVYHYHRSRRIDAHNELFAPTGGA